MKKILAPLAALGLLAMAGTGVVLAQEEGHNAAEPTHFPIHKPEEQSWSFAGPLGNYDRAQLQRGLKVYKEVCSACHSMNLVAFRSLADLGFTEAQVRRSRGIPRPGAARTRRRNVRPPGETFDHRALASREAAAAANNGPRHRIFADRQGSRRRTGFRFSDRHRHSICPAVPTIFTRC
jgi:ubiquinol-cytochrome c reductase cytochrome c1 subunit